jgi:hypothetical protein
MFKNVSLKHIAGLIRLCFHLVLAGLLATSLTLATDSLADPQQHQPTSKEENSLKTFLENYAGASNTDGKRPQYLTAFVDLRDNGTSAAIVYLTSNDWCGTGGCTMLILVPEKGSYRVVTKTTVTQLPIRVLGTKSNGWHDIGVRVQGGGIQKGYEAKLSFDGKSYPHNPSTAPAQPLSQKVAGEVVVPQMAKDAPLNP